MLLNREHFIILLEGRSIEVSPQDIIKTIQTNCSEWFSNKDFELYRGISNHKENYMMIDPTQHYRSTTTGYDLYNTIIDNHWPEYPKRSTSLICSQDKQSVEIFGSPYLVIPFNGAKFGICSGSDIWASFNNISQAHDLSQILCKNISKSLNQIDDSYNINQTANNLLDYQKLIKISEFIDKNTADFIGYFIIFNNKSMKSADRYMMSNSIVKTLDKISKLLSTKSLIDILQDDIFIKDGFKLSEYKKINLDPSDSNELWTESKCLLVKVQEFEEKDTEFRKLFLKKYNEA